MDVSLLTQFRKYDKPGPRYTSYPPAPIFSSEFRAQQYQDEIRRTNGLANNSDLSLYFHLPFCDTLCYFCGCTMLVTHSAERMHEYVAFLKKEIDLLAPLISTGRRVAQMHWGGGTPTSHSPFEIRELGEHVRRRFQFSGDVEVSVEVDPRGLTYDHLQALSDVGFTRASLGVQDFNEEVQHAINRLQSEHLTRQVVDWARRLGFGSINVDLIYGLPLQTVESFEKTLDAIIDISPERIAVYNFAYVPWMKTHQKIIQVGDLPTPEAKLSILAMTIENLEAAGYVYVGMDHFAKPDDELAVAQRNRTLHRNFQGYSTKAGCDLFGLGMSSISHFDGVYAQNAKTLPEYYAALDDNEFATLVGYRMTQDDQLRKHVIMRLMCDLVLMKPTVERIYGIEFDSYFGEALSQLSPLQEDELIEVTSEELRVTRRGRLFLRNIAMCFDAHLAGLRKEKPIFSRTV